MPRRGAAASAPHSPAPEPRFAPNGYRLPDPIREGEILTDVTKKQWRLGRAIGLGGFGEIYLASDDIKKPVGSDSQYVIKVEPHKNGPLFVEMNFYIRVAKPAMVEQWKKDHRMKCLGMPCYCGSGSHVYKGEKYRFLVLPHFGSDLHKFFEKHGRRFHLRTTLSLAIQIMDILEYIHEHGYSHSDIKDSNLLLGFGKGLTGQVYLLDYGLASKYVNRVGQHKEYRQDARKAHDGTLEYTSRDAHIGAHSRRGDMEILAYNMVQWVCGRLPWEDVLADPEQVAEQKRHYMSNIPQFLSHCFPNEEPPAILNWYLKYVAGLEFDTKPDYSLCKQMMKQAVRGLGSAYNGQITFDSPSPAQVNKSKSRKRKAKDEPENIGKQAPKRVARSSARKPCAQQNFNRMTRGSQPLQPDLRSRVAFSWEKVLLSDPEKQFRAHAEKVKQRKLKRNRLLSASAILEKTGSITPVANLINDPFLSPASALQLTTDAESLRNPTPAMREQLMRMRLKRGNVSPACSSRGKGKSESSSRCCSPVDNSTTVTPVLGSVMCRRERKVPTFNYAGSDSESNCSSESSVSELVPVMPVSRLPRQPIRTGLRNRQAPRRRSCDSDSNQSDSTEYPSTELISVRKAPRATVKTQVRCSKPTARRRSSSTGGNEVAKKNFSITKKYLRSVRSLRNTALQDARLP